MSFVPAGEQRTGERVRTLSGLREITSITQRGPPEPVYNLEVHGEHVYVVGTSGVLVHNEYIALGLYDHGLNSFAKEHGALTHQLWKDKLGTFDATVGDEFRTAFSQATNRADKIFFQLDGLGIPRAAREGQRLILNETTTSYELLQVLGKGSADEAFKRNVFFFRDGSPVDFDEILREALSSPLKKGGTGSLLPV